MPPEEIPLVIAVEFGLDNNEELVGREERLEHMSGRKMFASWYANQQPKGYKSVCGGVVYVQDSDIRQVDSADKRPPKAGSRYVWSDTNRKDGVMFAMILPEGHTLREPSPLPYEAKNFQGRLAVHWRTEPADGQFEISWRVAALGNKDLNAEVQRINKIIFDSRPAGALPEYDVAMSYASEDRAYVHQVATALKGRQITVFDYRDQEQAVATWGMDLHQCLSDIYSKLARYTVAFISEHYVRKGWTMHEMRSAQKSGFFAQRPYILPARFDNTEVPGLSPELVYASLSEMTAEELAAKIAKKVELSRI